MVVVQGGLCGCGGERQEYRSRPGSFHRQCKSCLADANRARYTRRMSASVCHLCSRVHDGELTTCAECTALERDRRRARRLEVFSAYGNRCSCCGEGCLEFLSIDHVNGDGADERRRHRTHGHTFYGKIIAAGFPARYQLLCHNCNFAKRTTPGRFCPVHYNQDAYAFVRTTFVGGPANGY